MGIEDGPHPPPPDLHSRWYDKQGKLLDLYNASELLGDPDYKRVASDVFVMGGEPVQVSTVWLALDHNWRGGRPLIFETMIFGGTHHLHCWRASTEQEALEAHAEAVTLLQLELGVMDEHGSDLRQREHRDNPGPD
jgi:hypothetical protein